MFNTLNTSHPLYGNILLCLGVSNDNTQYINAKGGANISAVGSGNVITVDPTYGKVVTVDNTAQISLGDVDFLDGLSACSLLVIQQYDKNMITANCSITTKSGGGDDTLASAWQSSENVNVSITNNSLAVISSTLTDGLHESAGVDPTTRHSAGYTLGAGGLITRVSNLKATPAAWTGTILPTAHALVIFPTTTEVINRTLQTFIIFDKELSDSEWSSVLSDTNLLYAGQAAVLSSPTATDVTGTSITLGASTTQATGYGTSTGYVVIDTVANLSGVTATQVKNGHRNNNTAALKAGNFAISQSPFTLALSSISFTIGDTYAFAWVQTNDNGDSNVLTSSFTVAGISVSGIPSSIPAGQVLSFTGNLVGTAQGSVTLTDSQGRVHTCTINTWPTATGSGTIEVQIPANYTSNLYPGSAQLTVSNSTGSDSEVVSTALAVDTGYLLGVIQGQDTGADAYIQMTPNPVVGDSITYMQYWRRTSDNGITSYPVSIDLARLTWSIPNTAPGGSYYFDISAYDTSDNTWDNTPARITFVVSQEDIIPEQFSIGADVTGSNPGTVVDRVLTPTGIDSGVDIAITVTNGTVSVAGGAFSSSNTFQAGQQLTVRGIAPAYSQFIDVTLNISGVIDTFRITSRAALVPTITVQPTDQNVTEGQQVTFALSATNAASYQWYRYPNTIITDATSSSYAFTTTLSDDNTSYFCRCTSSEGGFVNSSTVALDVQVANVTITSQVMRDASTKAIRASESNIPVVVWNADKSQILLSTTVNTNASGIWTLTSNVVGSVGDVINIEFPDDATNSYTGFEYTLT